MRTALALLALVLALPVAGCSKQQAASPNDGQTLFLAMCARCHGSNGQGGLTIAGVASSNLRDPQLHAQRTDAQLADVIAHGKGRVMPPFDGQLTQEQIAALVKQIRSFQ